MRGPFSDLKEGSLLRFSARKEALRLWKLESNSLRSLKNKPRPLVAGIPIFLWLPSDGHRTMIAHKYIYVNLYFTCDCKKYITATKTRTHIMYTCMHLREMISNAQDWATRRGLVRTNEVHGADEFRVPTESSCSFKETTRKEEEKSGSFEIEDPQGTLLDSSDLSAENAISQLVLCIDHACNKWRWIHACKQHDKISL